jgi:hypothetical protein
MLNQRKKFLLGEVLKQSCIAFVIDNATAPAINTAYIEITNSRGQSFRFDVLDHVIYQHENQSLVQCSLVSSVECLELRHTLCDFDLDPMSIGVDSSITGELIIEDNQTIINPAFFLTFGKINERLNLNVFNQTTLTTH